MNLVYLLDTNIISEPLRPAPNQNVMAMIEAHQHELTITAVVWHELLFGYERLPESKKKEAIGAYLFDVVATTMPLLPYEHKAAAWHAKERARLTNLGLPPSFVDGQIAAVAATNELILVTANTNDFADFQDLQIENWIR